jgi:hypothetical protein
LLAKVRKDVSFKNIPEKNIQMNSKKKRCGDGAFDAHVNLLHPWQVRQKLLIQLGALRVTW